MIPHAFSVRGCVPIGNLSEMSEMSEMSEKAF